MRVTRDGAVTAVLVVALAAWGLIVARTWDTWVGMNHATGTVAVLADAALHGEAAGHEGAGEYLGALYAPPYPLLVAGLRRAGLSWLHALRAASLGSALLLLAAAAWAARAAGASHAGVRVTLALLTACNLFKVASIGGRADLFSAALTVLAVAAWLSDRELKGWACAVLAAAAWACKVSEVTTPLAILGVGAIAREGAPAARFVMRFALACVLGVVLLLPFHSLSWYAEVFSTTLFAPPNTSIRLRGPAEVLRYLASFAELGLVAVMAVAAVLEPAWRRSPLRWTTGAALLVAMAVLANRGSDHNHLLTAIALAGVCAGAAWEGAAREGATREGATREGATSRTLALVGVLLLLPAASWRDVWSHARYAADPVVRRERVLAVVRAEPGPVLAEDPLLLLAAGKRSPISDPATLRSRARAGDPSARRIATDTAERRWALVVLESDPETSAAWYRDFHFGDAMMRPLRAGYARAGDADGFVLYRPRPAAPGHPPAAGPPAAPAAP